MGVIYLWLLILAMALCAGLFVWLERRQDRALRDSMESRLPPREITVPGWHDSIEEDTQPAVLDTREAAVPRERSRRA